MNPELKPNVHRPSRHATELQQPRPCGRVPKAIDGECPDTGIQRTPAGGGYRILRRPRPLERDE